MCTVDCVCLSGECLHEMCAQWSVCMLIGVCPCEVLALWSVCAVSGECVKCVHCEKCV